MIIDIFWINIFFFIQSFISLIILLKLSFVEKSLSTMFLSFSIFSVMLSNLLPYIFDAYSTLIGEWGNLISICFVLSALLNKIRISKPVFARFPFLFVFFPLISLFFYPWINQAVVIKDLLISTFQGGAILVGILVISISHLLHKQRLLLLLSCLLFITAYIGFWFINNPTFEVISIILAGFGMLTGAFGLKNISNQNY